ncbi:hypothetical protein AM629_06335 [Photorhabdus heterorhabditis]|uniref:Uncharacterized protein n=1 Tax=Photorhabdus heterorhabditis TaxID=880156 RepID=A0ABR5KEK6_9GAMM|nr:hypothetical protein [Photorhabdus heterorhabditis]KOY62829.1 hypothetical protein AM629_06335 [Photorhabdus heterorhabditis]
MSEVEQIVEVKTRTPRFRDSSKDPGMISVQLLPATLVFNNYIHAGDDQILKSLTSNSTAIYNLFRTVTTNNDVNSLTKIQNWFDTLLAERKNVADSAERVIESIDKKPKDEFFQIANYTPQSYVPVTILYNHYNTGQLIQHIFRINKIIERLYVQHLYGLIGTLDYHNAHSHLLADLRVGIDAISRTLNVRNRIKGKYQAEEFLTKIKQYKSIQQYIDAELKAS